MCLTKTFDFLWLIRQQIYNESESLDSWTVLLILNLGSEKSLSESLCKPINCQIKNLNFFMESIKVIHKNTKNNDQTPIHDMQVKKFLCTLKFWTHYYWILLTQWESLHFSYNCHLSYAVYTHSEIGLEKTLGEIFS